MTEAVVPSQIGSYSIISKLSHGGGGVVYRACRTGTADEVALKALESLRPEDQDGLRREIFILSRIEHPCVVKILDYGLHEGLPWYAMELLDRPTLEEAWCGPERAEAEAVFAISARLCDTLAFLHGEGIVHRDLKPTNVMLRREDPVLVDFGVATRFGGPVARESLEAGGILSGTVMYMSPEQYRGEFVDARSDLFSFGCMLYEALVGQPPFLHARRDHASGRFSRRPVPPAAVVTSIPSEIDELILALLDDEPHRRPGYADDVARVVRGHCRDVPGARCTTRPYVYRARLTGRSSLLSLVDHELRRAERGLGELLAVVGESGAGKTRFAMEVTCRASARGFQVLTGECHPVRRDEALSELRGVPLHPFAPILCAIADRCRHEGEQTSRELFGERAKTLAAFEPSIASIPGFDGAAQPQPLEGDAARARALSDLLETIRHFAARDPVAIVVDDAQWADDLSLEVLTSLARGALRDARVLLIATFRSEEAHHDLERVCANPYARRIDLDRLDAESIRGMVSDMLAMADPPQPLVRMLDREAEGNPFFVGEYVRAAVAASILIRPEGSWTMRDTGARLHAPLSVDLPTSIRELISERLRRVPAASATFVEAAAVLGRHFTIDLASELLSLRKDACLPLLAPLVRDEILQDDAHGRLQFSHDKLREVAYERLEGEHRKSLHARAAVLIEEQFGDTPDFASYYPQLANHWAVAGDDGRARQFFDLAGEHALSGGAYGEALQALTASREFEIRDLDRSTRLRSARRDRMLSVASFGVGDLDESIEFGEQALRDLGRRVPRRGLLSGTSIARALVAYAAVAGVPFWLQLVSGSRGDAAVEVALSWSQLANLYFFAGDLPRTFVSVLEALVAAERARLPKALAQACASFGFVVGTAGLRRASGHYFQRARQIAHDAADQRGLALALYLEAMHHIGIAGWDAARTLAEEAARKFDSIGDAHEAEIARTIGSHSYHYTGQLELAEAEIERVRRTATRRSNAQHIAWTQFMRSRILILRGRPDEAVELCREAAILLDPLPDTLSNVMLDGTLARALLYCRQYEEARVACRRLGTRIARGEWPATGQCIDGIGSAADVLMALGEQEGWRNRSLAHEADAALAALARFARIFPIGRPVLLRCRARRLARVGRHAAAERVWRRGLEEARRRVMPIEEAMVHLDRARILSGVHAATEEIARARDVLAPIGCGPFASIALLERAAE
jgi:tetratricopeptide (TPR) repeat protein